MTIRIRRVKILKKSKYTLIYTKCKYDERVKKMTDIHSFQLNYIITKISKKILRCIIN